MSNEVVNGLFALGGAIIGVAGTWIVTHVYRERKRLVVITSPLARLLDVGREVRGDVEITYKGTPVDALTMGEVALQNTGNTPVENINLVVSAHEGSSIIDVSVAANFSLTDGDIDMVGDELSREIAIKFLNRSDRIIVTYRLAGKAHRPHVSVRQLGVEVISKREFVNWIPDIYAEVVYEMFSRMPFFNLVGTLVKPYRLYLEARRKAKGDHGQPP